MGTLWVTALLTKVVTGWSVASRVRIYGGPLAFIRVWENLPSLRLLLVFLLTYLDMGVGM